MIDISKKRFTNGVPNLRRYHQAKWDEPVIFDLSTEGERAFIVPEIDTPTDSFLDKETNLLPKSMKREKKAALPELSQNRLLRHYLRLSQQTLGADLNVDVGQGTCTMKYNPKVNEQFIRNHKISKLHPRQPEETIQGMLKIIYDLQEFMKEISGLDAVSLHPRGGSQAIYGNSAILKSYLKSESKTEKDEIITTIFSHPSNGAAPKVSGFKVTTLYPNENGFPDVEALKLALSEKTAALFITNPEDTGIFNPKIQEFVDLVHGVGGLCIYDQANANGLLGVARAKEVGFDLCHFNLHKTFATPHSCGGPAGGVICASKKLEKFLPNPHVVYENGKYLLKDSPDSLGKISAFMGVGSVIVRAYAWIMSLGADGLKQVAQTAVLNNNYIMKQLLKIKGLSLPYVKNRIEQARYSWKELCDETGVHTGQIGMRAADFGVHYWTSHHPYVVPEPLTVEPTESYSKKDLDEFVQVLQYIADESRSNPEKVQNAPHNCPVSLADESDLDNPKKWAVTWRGYKRKLNQ